MLGRVGKLKRTTKSADGRKPMAGTDLRAVRRGTATKPGTALVIQVASRCGMNSWFRVIREMETMRTCTSRTARRSVPAAALPIRRDLDQLKWHLSFWLKIFVRGVAHEPR